MKGRRSGPPLKRPTVSSIVLDALKSHDVQPVPWSQREQVRAVLAA